MTAKFIFPLDAQTATLALVGGKGASLSRLVNAGFPVPGGFHVTTEAYHRFVEDNQLQPGINKALEAVDRNKPETLDGASQTITQLFTRAPIPDEVIKAILDAYKSLSSEGSRAVAVRSSATAEDLPEASFAGQQETYLNVIGGDQILDATRKCWASLWTPRAIGYRTVQGVPSEGIALAVVIQLMVSAEAAGVLFTANPVNGSHDEMVINASWGLGEAVVGGLVTPDSLVLEKPTFRLIKRDTAEKLIRTVQTDGGTQEEVIPENLRRAPVLSDQQAAELGDLGFQIEALYGLPMDIEWALEDGKFFILQARSITALPTPEPAEPLEWKLPKGMYAAMRNNIVELMTDPLTPLFKTLGLHAVNTSMNRLMDGFLGDTGVLPEEPIIAVNEYAYYNGSVKFGPMLKVMLDTRGIIKRMFTGAVERWTEQGRPRYIQLVETWESSGWMELSATEILEAVCQLAESAIDAYGALVSGVIPAAWMSEAWFTFVYKFYRRKGDPTAPTFLMGFDSLPIQAEKALYDLALETRKYDSLADYLTKMQTTDLVTHIDSEVIPVEVNPDQWWEWCSKFSEYLQKFGHMIYNLDFGYPVPADDPAPVLEVFKLFLRGEGADPYERQRESQERRTTAIQGVESRLQGRRLKAFRKNLVRAQKYAPLREDGLADVGLSYPLLRKMLRELGTRFVRAGMIEQVDDIFWLTQEEVEVAATRMDAGQDLENLSEVVPQRKAIRKAATRLSPPLMLPQIKLFGIDLVALKQEGLKAKKGDILKGVAASPGTVSAPACVLHGPEDFSKMRTGDVLVASLTTPAWTPLFARAAAVVTDIGGPLSHGSIVAREYGIPAVLGTGSATERISNGQIITVDGGAGVVTLSESFVG